MKPPENKPNNNDEKVIDISNIFEKYNRGLNSSGNSSNKSYLVNINGHPIILTKDQNGKVTATSLDDTTDGFEIACGLEDAFAECPDSLKEAIFSDKAQMKAFILFISTKISDSQRTATIKGQVKDYSLSKNVFCTAIGYFAALWIGAGFSKRASDCELKKSMGAMYEIEGSNDESLGLLADIGFWNAWQNSTTTGIRHSLNFDFDRAPGVGPSSWSDKATFCDLVRAQTIHVVASRIAYVVNNGNHTIEEVINIIANAIGTVTIDLTTGLGVASTIVAIAQGIVSQKSDYPSKCGANNAMAQIAGDRGLIIKRDGYLNQYGLSDDFVSLGILAAYYKAELNNVAGQVANGDGKGGAGPPDTRPQIGDLFIVASNAVSRIYTTNNGNTNFWDDGNKYFEKFSKSIFGVEKKEDDFTENYVKNRYIGGLCPKPIQYNP